MSRVHQALKKAEIERFGGAMDQGTGYLVNIKSKSSFDGRLISLFDPFCLAAEQYRKLRTKIVKF